MFIVSFGSIIFFIVTCCCAKKSKITGSQKLFLYITLGILVVFAAMFFTLVGYIATIDKDYNKVNCVINKLPNDILNGTSEGEIEFIGLLKFQNML